MQVIIIGECLLVEQNTPNRFNYEIHYKGPLCGDLIEKVVLVYGEAILNKNEEYILHVEVLNLEGRILYGNILRHKNIKCIQNDIF